MPRPAERIWGLTFANLRHSEIDRNFGVLRIYCRVLFGCWNGTFYRVKYDLYCSPDGSICRVNYNSKYTLLLFYFSFVNSIGHANSVPDGSSPRGYNQELVLGCRLNILVHLVAIFSLFPNMISFFFSLFFLSLGCANSAPDGSSPRGYSQGLVLGCRLPQFLYCHTRNFTFCRSSPRAFGEKLVFDQRLPKY